MKNNYVKNSIPYKLYAFFLVIAFIIGLVKKGNAQDYYSNFPTAAGNYSIVEPSGGGLCTTPSWNDPSFGADADLTNYAVIQGLLSTTFTCTDINTYSYRARLNFTDANTAAPAGYAAGFRMQFLPLASLAALQSNIAMRTYYQGNLSEQKVGSDLLNLELLGIEQVTDVYFITTQPFDEVEIQFGNALINLNVAFQFRVFYGFGRVAGPLPLSFTDLNYSKAGTANRLTWKTANEINTANFNIERSDNGTTFTSIATMPAGGNTVSASYTYTDNVSVKQQAYYRIKANDKDGRLTYSRIIAVQNKDVKPVKIYPTILNASQPLYVQWGYDEQASAGLINSIGGQAKNIIIKPGQNVINTSGLQAGIYILRVITNKSKNIITQQVVVQ